MAAYRLTFPAITRLLACCACLVVPLAATAEEPIELLETPAHIGAIALDPVPLSLPEAKCLALDNSPILALARMSTSEKQHALRAVHADYFPKVLGSFTYLHYDSPLGSVLTFRNGASIPINLIEQDQTLGHIMGAQPITALVKVRGLERLAEADQRNACNDVEKARRAILNGAEQLYVGLWATQRIRGAVAASVEASKPLAKNSDPSLRAVYVEAVQGLQAADAQIVDLQVQLNDLMGWPDETPLMLEELPPLGPGAASIDHAVEMAVTNSPEICEAVNTLEKASAGLMLAKSDYIPDVNVFGGYLNQNGIGAIQNNIGFVGGMASYTLFDAGKRRHVVRQRDTQVAMAQAAIRKTRLEVAIKARKAFRAYQQSGETLDMALQMRAVRQAIMAKKLAPADALDAAKDLLTAEIEAIKAELTQRMAYSELLTVTGQQ